MQICRTGLQSSGHQAPSQASHILSVSTLGIFGISYCRKKQGGRAEPQRVRNRPSLPSPLSQRVNSLYLPAYVFLVPGGTHIVAQKGIILTSFGDETLFPTANQSAFFLYVYFSAFDCQCAISVCTSCSHSHANPLINLGKICKRSSEAW